MPAATPLGTSLSLRGFQAIYSCLRSVRTHGSQNTPSSSAPACGAQAHLLGFHSPSQPVTLSLWPRDFHGLGNDLFISTLTRVF